MTKSIAVETQSTTLSQSQLPPSIMHSIHLVVGGICQAGRRSSASESTSNHPNSLSSGKASLTLEAARAKPKPRHEAGVHLASP